MADLNGDGKADSACSAGGLMMNNGDGTFAPQVAYGILSAMGVGDFDGDGRLDVVSASDGADGLQVFWNNPGATFATTVRPIPRGATTTQRMGSEGRSRGGPRR